MYMLVFTYSITVKKKKKKTVNGKKALFFTDITKHLDSQGGGMLNLTILFVKSKHMLAKHLLFSESLYMKSAEIQRSFSLHFIFRVDFLNFCYIFLSMSTNSYSLNYLENKSFPWTNTDSPMKTKRNWKALLTATFTSTE